MIRFNKFNASKRSISIKKNFYPKLFFLLTIFVSFVNISYAQEREGREAVLFQSAKKAQRNKKWNDCLIKFKQVIASYPQTSAAQKAHIEIGKYYKYNRSWNEAITQYHHAINISPASHHAHDAKTAEAAIYYFRQDFPRALGIFKEVLRESKDWDQIKYCSYWIRAIKRKMIVPDNQSFSCGKEALRIALGILGIETDKKEFSTFFNKDKKQLSLFDLTRAASQKGLKPKVVKVTAADIQNLNTPFIALVNPEHYIVVTEAVSSQVKFIDPSNKNVSLTENLAKFGRDFKGYALVFLKDTKLVELDYPAPEEQELKVLKGGICDCCPPSNLGGPGGSNQNAAFDGRPACGPGMPSWMVNTVNLNLLIQDIDFRYTARGMLLELIRTFNADDPKDTAFGRSWTFNYNISLVENPDQSIDVTRGDGRIDHFFWNGMRYQGPNGVHDILVKNIDGSYSLKIKQDKTTQNFNSQGVLFNITDRNDNSITFSYDAQGKLNKITDPNGKEINFSYGANNKVSSVTLADGRNTKFIYDANNNLIQSIDMKGAAADFAYDANSYLTSMTTPHQGITTFDYETSDEGYALKSITDTQGNKRSYDIHYYGELHIKVTDSRNNSVVYSNNYDGYTESLTSPSGNRVSYEYDDFGNRIKIKDKEGNATTFAYDARGNITSITDALNNKTTLTYDDNDNLISTLDPKDNLCQFTYDTKNNLIQTADPDNQRTDFTYNTYGLLTRISDAKGQVTEFSYDAEGNLIKQANPLGKNTFCTYDTLGRISTLTDPKGNTFNYTYDGVDHVTQMTYPDSATTAYNYNCCNLIGIQDKLGALNFTYDALGRVTSFTNYDNKVISYEYDTEGNLITLTYPDNKKVNYTYDVDNRLTKVTDWLGNATEYNYDSRGNLSFSASPGLLTTYEYDAASRLTKLINYNSNTFVITSGFEFTLDSLGNRAQVKRYLPLNLPTFNLTNATYSYNSDNQLVSATGKTFEYDDNGNLIQGLSPSGTLPESTYTYNYDNQLTQYVEGTVPAGGLSLSFEYDSLGNRIQKTSGSNLTKYIVDPNRALPSVLAETDASGNITSYCIYGLGLISKIEGTSAYFYQYDGLGSTVAITDKTGTLKNKYAYDDFGNLATNSTGTVGNSFKYVGRFGVMTDAPDLLYMRARYYMPSIGRFINKDPIGDLNKYIYVDDNPVNYIDPEGQSPLAIAVLLDPTQISKAIFISAVAYIAVKATIDYAFNSGVCKFSRSKKGPLWNAPGMPGWRLRQYEQEQPGAFKPPPKFGKGNWWEKIIWALGQIAQAFHKD